MKEYTVITYTTQYRRGGDKFSRVAQTMAREKLATDKNVICHAVESKKELKSVFADIRDQGNGIKEFHFIGHSGMYGPMFGTVEYPEQFSPYEIDELKIPFSENASAFFHCCRSARWFAPYFARTKHVDTYGYHWYTTFSSKREYFRPDFSKDSGKELYCFGCPGRRSHGYLTSIKKYLGFIKAEELKHFSPDQGAIDNTYNRVANLYDEVFKDIKVRSDEYAWINKHLPGSRKIKIIDIGCGNGALLRELAPQIAEGVGVDVSENLLKVAKNFNTEHSNLSFTKLKGPSLPFDDNCFDLVISMMSFRYLDWDPIMSEIQRITKPEGKLLIVDMVTAPVKIVEYPKLLLSKLKHYAARIRNPEFYNKLRRLVTDPNWSTMLKLNPIRSEHEMAWYLESRFPGRKVQIINIGYNSRILAFDSGSMKNIKNLNLSYP